MAITVRKGNWADFDPYKMRPAEFSIILDREQLYYCTSPGNVKRCATKEDVAEILETSEEAYDGLQQLLTELESETVLTGILNDISTLLDDVAINKSNILTNTQDIVTNTQNIVINTQDIADNRTDIDTNTQGVADLDTGVSTHLAESVTKGNPHGLDAKANKVQPSWLKLTLQSGWTGDLEYRKNDIGQIELQGYLIPGTKDAGTIITTLPVGYKPAKIKTIITTSNSTGKSYIDCLVQPDGNLQIFGANITSGTFHVNEIIN